ncbi:hypothetical protein M1437_01075 [Patescibacteria group bacterium]|nr:hypothetical protein [Patescibacteria group bacterium]
MSRSAEQHVGISSYIERPGQSSISTGTEIGRERISWKKALWIMTGMVVGAGVGFLVGSNIGQLIDIAAKNPTISYETIGFVVGGTSGALVGAIAADRFATSKGV